MPLREMELAEILGDNKERDKIICDDYIDGFFAQEIHDKWLVRHPEDKLDIVVSRINQIIKRNSNYIDKRIAWSKAKRVHLLQRFVEDNPKTRKDPVDVLEQIRKEVEGDVPLIDMRQQNVTISYGWIGDSNVEDNFNKLHTAALPAGDTQVTEEISSGEDRKTGREDGMVSTRDGQAVSDKAGPVLDSGTDVPPSEADHLDKAQGDIES